MTDEQAQALYEISQKPDIFVVYRRNPYVASYFNARIFKCDEVYLEENKIHDLKHKAGDLIYEDGVVCDVKVAHTQLEDYAVLKRSEAYAVVEKHLGK